MQEGLIVNNSTDQFIIRTPPNNGAFFDGTYYWLFYVESSTLKCKYGASLDLNMSSCGDLVSNVANLNATWSMIFGQVSSTWYAWAVVGDTSNNIELYRWELTASGPANEVSSTPATTDSAPKQGYLTHDYGGVTVTNLYGSVSEAANQLLTARCCRVGPGCGDLVQAHSQQ